MTNRVKTTAAGLTDLGRVRESNQDQFVVAEIQRTLAVLDSSLGLTSTPQVAGPAGHLLVVADGVGGGAGGDRASALALKAFLRYATETMQLGRLGFSLDDDLLEEFSEAIHSSHSRVRREAQTRPELAGMATTLTMAYVLGLRAYIGHVGDSRCYLIRDGEALRLTRDQTYAQALVDRGVLLPRDADASRWSHVLANAVGGERREQPEVLTYRCVLQEGDRLLLCTDGLTKHVPEVEIPKHFRDATAQESCSRLLEAALEGGGTDNVTVVVALVGSLEVRDPNGSDR